MALVGTEVMEESVKGSETLVGTVETVGTPEAEVEARVGDEDKARDVVTSEAVVGPEGDMEALVPRICGRKYDGPRC